MITTFRFPIGPNTWAVKCPTDRVVAVTRPAIDAPELGPRELVAAALEAPFRFEPMRRAVTPDDAVAILLDPGLPHPGELLAGILEHLQSAGVNPENVTVLSPSGANDDTWIDELPDEFADVKTETHDPADRTKLAYIGTTAAGRRVYLNKTLVEAGFGIVLTARGYHPRYGRGGAEVSVFPRFADAESQVADLKMHFDAPEQTAARAEAVEVANMLGSLFLVQVVPGAYDEVHDVVAGLLAQSSQEGLKRHDARWRGSVATRPDTVIATVPDEDATFADFARAAAAAARVADPDARIVVLGSATPDFTPASKLLRRTDDADDGRKRLAREKPADLDDGYLWATSAGRCSLFIACGWDDEAIEELYANPVRKAAEVQNLVDAAERLLIIPDAHRSLIDPPDPK